NGPNNYNEDLSSYNNPQGSHTSTTQSYVYPNEQFYSQQGHSNQQKVRRRNIPGRALRWPETA
ncbi:unnamed protein product, partial [Rotaria sordida]